VKACLPFLAGAPGLTLRWQIGRNGIILFYRMGKIGPPAWRFTVFRQPAEKRQAAQATRIGLIVYNISFRIAFTISSTSPGGS